MKRFLLLILTAFLSLMAVKAQEAYAVYTSDGTLTFYYDNQKSSRSGTKYGMNTGYSDPGWYTDHRTDIKKAVFDPSFAGARPTSTYHWFAVKDYPEVSILSEIVGIQYLNTSAVTNMGYMFNRCSSLTSLDVTHFDTSKVTSMSDMFYLCRGLTSLDVTHFDTSNVTDMSDMFYRCNGLTSLDVTHFDTSNVTDMHWMFNGCSGLTSLDVTHFDTSNVTSMYCMFYECSGLTSLDVTHFDTSKVTSMYGMFFECSGLTSLDVTHFDTSKVTNMGYMFSGCGLTSLDVTHFDTSKVTIMYGMFSRCSGLTSLDVSHFDTSKVTDMSNMFWGCNGLTSLNVTHFDTSNVTHMGYMFSGCSGLTSLDVTHFDTSNVTYMGYMFSGCNGLTSLDITHFDTSNVTDMFGMFYGCSGLTSLDLSHFDTSKVTSMGAMFNYCSGLTSLDVTHFNTSNVTNMSSMFSSCRGLTSLDVTHFDTNNVTSMSRMFCGCSGLTSLDVTHFDTSNVTDMREMFSYCSGLTSLDVTHFDTSKVTSMYGMFRGCSGLTSLDLSNFDTSNVTSMGNTNTYYGGMFQSCSNLTTIYVGEGWNTDKVTDSDNMFLNCNNLVGGMGTKYDANHVNKAYAHIDGGSSNPGYLTDKNASPVVSDLYLQKQELKPLWEGLKHAHPWMDNGSQYRDNISDLGWEYVPNTLGRYYDEGSRDIKQGQTDNVVPNFGLNVSGSAYALEGLVWTKQPHYAEPKPFYDYIGETIPLGDRMGDEEGWAADGSQNCKTRRIHLWDSPLEALADPDGAAMLLFVQNADGIDLKEYLGIHYLKQTGGSQSYEIGTWKCGEESVAGLHYEFEFVDYYNNSFQNHESRYASFTEWTSGLNVGDKVKDWNKTPSRNGIIVARSVDADGQTINVRSTTSVDREPLVRVMVKNDNGDVLLEGYILVWITYLPENLSIDNYPEYSVKLDLGKPVTMNTTWQQFDTHVLQEKLPERFKVDADVSSIEDYCFDDYYWADCIAGSEAVPYDDARYVTPNSQKVNDAWVSGRRGYRLKLYNFGDDIYGNNGMPPIRGNANPETSNAFGNKELGTAAYFPHAEGFSRHAFSWRISKEELEFLTRGKAVSDYPIKITRWFLLVSKDSKGSRGVNNYSVPYPYLWVKMTIEITQDMAVSDSDDLQDFINGLGDNKGTEDDPVNVPVDPNGLTIDNDVEIVDDLQLAINGNDTENTVHVCFWSGFINIGQSSGLSFKNVTFAGKDVAATVQQRAAGNGGGIRNGGTLKFANCTFLPGDYTVENSSNTHIGEGVTGCRLVNKTGGRINVTSPLTDDLAIAVPTEADVEPDVAIVTGVSDTDHILMSLPSGYAYKYDATAGGIVVYSTTGITAVGQQATVKDSYDTTGRRVDNNSKGLHMQRMSDGTVRKVMVNK